MTPNGQPAVLIVDDEDMVITSIRAFLQLETEYRITGLTVPEEAVKFLETNPVDVVVSDYLMPKDDGAAVAGQSEGFAARGCARPADRARRQTERDSRHQ
jgi:DNA-binding NarL/FixJ family response regulator